MFHLINPQRSRNSSSDDSVDFSDDDDETEMDLEMRMAYKEFIAGGKQEQANKQNNRQKK